VYQDTFEPENFKETTPAQFPNNLFYPMVDAEKQFQILCISDRIHFTPSYMFNKVALEMVGFYDESERLVEDYPMWLKLTKAGIRLHYFHAPTVGYRIHEQATNNTGNKVLFKPSVVNSFSIRKQMCHKHLPWEMVASEHQQYISSRLFLMLGLNIKNRYTILLYKFCCFYLNPFHYVFVLKKRLPSTKNIIFYQ
jgi:alpha-1,3-rhamnosyltransferase